MATRPLSKVLDTLSGRWSVLVLNAVADGYCRFNDLHRHLEGINRKVLVEALYKLQRDGYLDGPLTLPGAGHRNNAVPYELTELGWRLRELIDDVDRWSEEQEPNLVRARAEFEELAAVRSLQA